MHEKRRTQKFSTTILPAYNPYAPFQRLARDIVRNMFPEDRFQRDDLEAALTALVFDSDAEEDSDDKGASKAADAPTTAEAGDNLEAAFAALVFDSDSEE